MDADEIRRRMAMIAWNLANPPPGRRKALGAARREARAALGTYRAALRIIRKG
jgi:hypothetical protein